MTICPDFTAIDVTTPLTCGLMATCWREISCARYSDASWIGCSARVTTSTGIFMPPPPPPPAASAASPCEQAASDGTAASAAMASSAVPAERAK